MPNARTWQRAFCFQDPDTVRFDESFDDAVAIESNTDSRHTSHNHHILGAIVRQTTRAKRGRHVVVGIVKRVRDQADQASHSDCVGGEKADREEVALVEAGIDRCHACDA